MHRKGTSDLYSRVISVENLREAARVAFKNAETKTKQMRKFMEHLDERVEKLHKELADGTYKTSPYHKFKVYEPKEREISSLPFRDRVVHHACMLVLLPIWMKKFTRDTYNCLKGRGTHGFVRAIKKVIRLDKIGTRYVLQLDIRHFYESLNHDILEELIRWTIKDEELIAFLRQIIETEVNGVPIGNYLSQFFATLYLARFDHFVKEVLRVKYYFRYCDDLIFFAETKEELWRIFRGVSEYISSLKLDIKPNYRVFPLETGLDVVGYVFFPDHTLLRKRNKLKFERKCAVSHNKGLTGKAFKVQIGSYIGLLRYCNSINLKRKWFGDDYDICMAKKFRDIADVEDKRTASYEGEAISIEKLIDKEITFDDVREVVVHGKNKVIVQVTVDGEKKYFFSGATKLHDQLMKYQERMPFDATIIKVVNKRNNNTYYALS